MKRWRDKEEFKAHVLVWAVKLDVKVRALYVRPMRNKWASCSMAGTLSFNDELLEMERDLGEYVIVHELLHFSVPNHGKLWKSLMRAYIGEYEEFEAKMKKATKPTERGSARNRLIHLDETRAVGSTETVTDELRLRER